MNMFVCANCDRLKDQSEVVPDKLICFDCEQYEKEEHPLCPTCNQCGKPIGNDHLVCSDCFFKKDTIRKCPHCDIPFETRIPSVLHLDTGKVEFWPECPRCEQIDPDMTDDDIIIKVIKEETNDE